MTIIKVPERGSANIDAGTWRLLAESRDFWRLVDSNVLRAQASGLGQWQLRGTCYVGRAIIGEVSIEATEKFEGALAAMLAAGAYSAPKLTKTPSPVTTAGSSTALLVSQFVQAARAYLSGPKRTTYDLLPEEGALLGGRLNMPRTSRMRSRGVMHKVAFDRTYLTSDVPLNRCIYAALSQVERLAQVVQIDALDRLVARSLRLSLSDCARSVIGRPPSLFAKMAASEASSRRALEADAASLAGAILDSAGFGGTEEWHKSVERSWFVNLENLFERGVRRILSDVVNSKFHVTGALARPPLFPENPSRYNANPDAVIWSGQSAVAIVDAKYKDLETWPIASDIFELVAHAAAYGAKKALLFYPSEVGFQTQYLGRAATDCKVWAFAVPIERLQSSIERAARSAGLPVKTLETV